MHNKKVVISDCVCQYFYEDVSITIVHEYDTFISSHGDVIKSMDIEYEVVSHSELFAE